MITTIVNLGKKLAAFSRRYLAFVITISALAIMLALGVIFNIGAAASDTAVKKHDQFSELYFSEPNNLPKLTADVQTSIPFTVVNHTGRQQSYTYRVTLSENNGKTTSYEKTVQLDNEAKTEQAATVKPTSPRTLKTVTIELIATKQTIQFRSYP